MNRRRRGRGRILEVAGKTPPSKEEAEKETPLSKEEESEKTQKTNEWHKKIDELIKESAELVESSQKKNEEFKKKIDELIQESEKLVESTQEKNEEFKKKIDELIKEKAKLVNSMEEKIGEFEKKNNEFWLEPERITKNIAFDKLEYKKLENFRQNIDKLKEKKKELVYPSDDEKDDGVPNKKGIIQDGHLRGQKDHKEGSPYAEDCFLLDAYYKDSMLDQYNPERYNVFGYLTSGILRINGIHDKSIQRFKNLMPDYFDDSGSGSKFFPDEYLDEKIYKKRIDEWIEKVRNSKAKAVKVVIYSHGDKASRALWCAQSNSADKINKITKKYDGTVDLYNENAIKCLQYLFEKLTDINKNINVVNPACYAAEFFDRNGQQSIVPMIKDMAKKIKQKSGKDVIYTCNYSNEASHFRRPKSLLRYYIYNDKQKDFVSLSPNFDRDKKHNSQRYSSYTEDRKKQLDKIYEKFLEESKKEKNRYNTPIKRYNTINATPALIHDYKKYDLQRGSAYINAIKNKLLSYVLSYGDDDEKEQWVKEIQEINEILKKKDYTLLEEKIAILQRIAELDIPDLSSIIKEEIEKVEKCRQNVQSLINDDNETEEDKKFFKENFPDAYYEQWKNEIKNKFKPYEKWVDFIDKYPQYFFNTNMPNDVKKHHRRQRSYEFFFDNETLKQMKEAKDKKNEILFELNKDKNKEEENKNEIKEISANANLNLENKSQINEIK